MHDIINRRITLLKSGGPSPHNNKSKKSQVILRKIATILRFRLKRVPDQKSTFQF